MKLLLDTDVAVQQDQQAIVLTFLGMLVHKKSVRQSGTFIFFFETRTCVHVQRFVCTVVDTQLQRYDYVTVCEIHTERTQRSHHARVP